MSDAVFSVVGVVAVVALLVLLARTRRTSREFAERARSATAIFSERCTRLSLDDIVADIARRRTERLEPVRGRVPLVTLTGTGTTLYGTSAYDDLTGSYCATCWVTLLWVPLIPLRRYRVVCWDQSTVVPFFLSAATRIFVGQLPLRSLDRWVALLGWVLVGLGVIVVRASCAATQCA